MYKALLLMAGLSCIINTRAQDTLNLKDKKPFDQDFVLKFPTGNLEKAKTASFFEVNKKGCLRAPKTCFNIRNLNPFRKKDVYGLDLKVVRQDTLGNVFIAIPPLEPNKEYFLILNYVLNSERLEDFYTLLDSNNNVTAQKLLDTITLSTQVIMDTRYVNQCQCPQQDTFQIATFDDLSKFYTDSLKNLRQQFATKTASKMALTARMKDCSLKLEDSFIAALLKSSQTCIVCKDSLPEYKILSKGYEDFMPFLMSLNNIPNTIDSGYLDFSGLQKAFFINKGNIKTDQRINNLSSSISSMLQLLRMVDYLHLKYTLPNYSTNRSQLVAFLDCLTVNFESLNNYKIAVAAIDKELENLSSVLKQRINNYEGLWLPMPGSLANTYSYGFETRSKYVLMPDFGFMAYGNLGGYRGFWGVAPYLGFHVNFRPLNTELPFGPIPHKGILGHLSFTGGALIGSFKEEGKREGLIGNTAIFTGLGWAFTHAVRLNVGSLWYRKMDPNPLISHETVSATPYAGLSIDLRLHDIYDAFTKIFN